MSRKTLVIGDNLKTDIKGANSMNLDSIFITGGIHKSKINNEEDIEELLKKHIFQSLKAKQIQKVGLLIYL